LHRVPFPLAFCADPIIGRVTASRALTLWLPVLAWAALIFTLSSIPNLSTAEGVLGDVLSYGAHATEYAIFGVLLARALDARVLAWAAGVAYAITDEIHQSFVPGRQTSAFDLLVDAVGLAVGVLAFERARR
jgi:VanZ like family